MNGGQDRRRGGGHHQQRRIEVLFDPSKPERELYDELAEKQADMLQVNSSQLRRFFGEIKDLYRQFNALAAADAENPEARLEIYQQRIEPRFKMIRSKVSYASRAGGQAQLASEFADFLTKGIERVKNDVHFTRFVTHLEAVVGFMYGKGKVRR